MDVKIHRKHVAGLPILLSECGVETIHLNKKIKFPGRHAQL
jgi:hypothetical protein